MDTIRDPAPPRRSGEPTSVWPTVAVAALASAGAIVLSLATPSASTAALSAGRARAAPAIPEVAFVERPCRA